MSSIVLVKEYLAKWGLDKEVREFSVSSATVELAAQALGVAPARIAKSITFANGSDRCIMVVTAGDARVNSGKFKSTFGCKASMLSPLEVKALTGHDVGGVCPFALPATTTVYLDISLKRFDTVYPACGSANSAIALSLAQLGMLAGTSTWVDVCNAWQTLPEDADGQ